MRRPRLTLIGYRASGKTTAGRQAAVLLGWPFVDADLALAEDLGVSAGTYLAAHGEPAFRDAEQACLAKLLAGDGPCVLATGGGAILRPANRDLLAARGGLVAYLAADAATLAARLHAAAGDRPSLTGAGVAAEVPRLLAERAPLYAAAASVRIDASREPHTVAADLHRAVLAWWGS
jgi:shikimate kinase